MVERIKLGLFYQNYQNWAGGTYYVQNLLQALSILPDAEKPEVTILCDKQVDYQEISSICNYPFLKYQNINLSYNLFQKVNNKIYRLFFKKNLFEKRPNLDVVFPLQGVEFMYFTELCKHRLFWIPDFQEQHLPQFFNEKELDGRKSSRTWICKLMPFLLLSSQSAEADFLQFYKPIANCQSFVLPFAVTHQQDYKQLNINHLKEKYQLPERYFFAPNQFWKHKNHQLILDAVLELKHKNIIVNVAFSGKEYDFRNPDYTKNLKKFVQQNNLEKQICFLGFIDRNEQLQLMKNAQAVVQASLFEGWSTVVEDAKAMNQYVLASDLQVHKEQLLQNGAFFNRLISSELANLLAKYTDKKPEIIALDYNKNIADFAANFISILKKIIQ